MMKKLVIFSLPLLFLLAVFKPIYSITWCHDYTLYVLTGKDADKTSPVRLRQSLKDLGFKSFKFTNAAQNPMAQSKLRAGDVIIIGDAHSGIVNGSGLIDHFIQKFGASGTVYLPQDIFVMENFKRNWTLLQMINFQRKTPDGRTIQPYADQEVEVWRNYAK
jgi:hypothetical protein